MHPSSHPYTGINKHMLYSPLVSLLHSVLLSLCCSPSFAFSSSLDFCHFHMTRQQSLLARSAATWRRTSSAVRESTVYDRPVISIHGEAIDPATTFIAIRNEMIHRWNEKYADQACDVRENSCMYACKGGHDRSRKFANFE